MRQHRKPTLVCLNNSSEPPRLSRYIPKPTGGFFSETFEIVDREQAAQALNVDTMENFRLGKMRDQDTPPELVEQPSEVA